MGKEPNLLEGISLERCEPLPKLPDSLELGELPGELLEVQYFYRKCMRLNNEKVDQLERRLIGKEAN